MFYKQNGIVAGILLLILFAGAIGLVSVQMDKTVNRMHYSVVEEMGEYRTELIRQDFQKTAELVESMQDYLATRGYQKEQFEELIALLIRQDNKVSRIWFETEGKRTICTDSGIRESEAGPSKERNGGLYAEDSTYYWTLYGRQGEVALGIDIALDHLHAYFSNLLPAGKNYAYILNDSGVIVTHPEEKWLGMRLLDSLERRRVKQVVGENKRIHVTGFSQFLLLPVDKIYYPLTVGTEKCTVVINVVQLDNQEAMADFHRYALWIVVFTVVIFIVLLAYSQRRWRKEYDLRQKAEQEAIRHDNGSSAAFLQAVQDDRHKQIGGFRACQIIWEEALNGLILMPTVRRVHQDHIELIIIRIIQQVMLQRVHVIDIWNLNVMQQHIGHAEQIWKRLFLDSVNAVIKLLLSRSIGYLLG